MIFISNEGENGGYPPMMNLEGYEVRVIDDGGIMLHR